MKLLLKWNCSSNDLIGMRDEIRYSKIKPSFLDANNCHIEYDHSFRKALSKQHLPVGYFRFVCLF